MATKKHVNPGSRNDPTIAKLMNIAKNCKEESVFQKNPEYVKFKANKKITFSEIDLLQNGLCKFCDYGGETLFPEERIYWAKRVLEEKVGDQRQGLLYRWTEHSILPISTGGRAFNPINPTYTRSIFVKL